MHELGHRTMKKYVFSLCEPQCFTVWVLSNVCPLLQRKLLCILPEQKRMAMFPPKENTLQIPCQDTSFKLFGPKYQNPPHAKNNFVPTLFSFTCPPC